MKLKCRFCNTKLTNSFVDLGKMPLSNRFLNAEELNKPEHFYPLHAYVCDNCFLVQLPNMHSPKEIFEEYAYFSSVSLSWLDHAKRYTEKIISEYSLSHKDFVVEIASNDGYLLRFFKEKSIPVLGIEPAKNVAKKAKSLGIPTVVDFFGISLAKDLKEKGIKADLLIANNVLAHVPDLHDFVSGMKLLLSEKGIITVEVPHLLKLIEKNEFDTIYHEHFSYFSFYFLKRLFAHYELKIFDVEKLKTHGGSLRLYISHKRDDSKDDSYRVKELEKEEKDAHINDLKIYKDFKTKVNKTKREILKFLIKAKDNGKKVVGFGAPAKGNVLLNYCGIREDLIDFVVDNNPYKQGKFLPGTHIPVYEPDKIKEAKPDYVVILPWNIKKEIAKEASYIKDWGGRFVTFIPEVRVF